MLIVVPTLNSHTLLPRLLGSLVDQSWPHWRLLFIDGPSEPDHRQWLATCCIKEPRCSWIEQKFSDPGIFGAMNQGFLHAGPSDWLLFWGSDDWAAGPDVLAKAIAAVSSARSWPDLLVCKGRYVDSFSEAFSRPTVFQPSGLLASSAYRRALLFGSTPPHQGTLIGPVARRRLSRYAPGLRLSADLDYFLELSRYSDLCVQCLDLELVHMSDAGVSGQQTRRRLQEVLFAYRRRFGNVCWLPFILRYVRRLLSRLILF